MASRRFGVLALLSQIILLILFVVWVRYDGDLGDSSGMDQSCATRLTEIDCLAAGCTYNAAESTCSGTPTILDQRYPYYQDVHVMIFIGFGMLMTFLSRYGFSAVAYNMFLACIAFQWAQFTNTFWHRIFEGEAASHKIRMTVENLITGDFAAASVLVAYGAVIGKTTPEQLLVMALLQLIFYSLNESIGVIEFQAVDVGGSMYVHAFGAYFGLAVSFMLGNSRPTASGKQLHRNNSNNGSSSTSDVFAMIGTLFLFMFWPSFNGALASGSAQHRVVINTVIAIAFSAMSTFAFSNLFRRGRFNMVDIQNATLAGGVAVGSSADLLIEPYGAALIGFVAGLISVVGYVYISGLLDRYLRIHDTAGVHNLHGMPGVVGGLGGVIAASLAKASDYGSALGEIYAARATGTTAGEQAGNQLLALVVTLGLAIGGGLATGFVLRLLPAPQSPFHDREFWDIEEHAGAEASDEPDTIPLGSVTKVSPLM
ncbi:uncharacterized protein MONBRDRAFT_38134 [Monosiga brevicollis MX1]|uniref:Ammonium transporter AmtB-like domain-containing protein n=1 Tax=Monosiga brevicollis TaxID=81824 RepID=A9V5W4_MONBE|nr:uncharacterized protein MONBRDRAFT_38134 [Monosiga brevicollis MX1]EDQ87116.1 predicted protein [Monosiga brevicollis MX1]|eukprot:XP_001748059.1 hypothetical protein [Monosiga brevicollis MX1]